MQKALFLICTIWLSLAINAFAQNANIALRSSVKFPGQTLANVCGYAANGREYALLGASKGLIILDVTNPDAPVNIVQIPGPDNLWKEIKVYKQYAYVTSEGGEGVQIVDMGNLPSADLPFHHYKGNGAISGQLNSIHALHIDETAGFLYLWGSNLFNGTAVVCDLNADPYNPNFAGKFDKLGYIHDGYVDNDTMYAAHIYEGLFSIVNMADKSNPVLLGTQETPNKFPHNTWLSEDRKILFTTDEVDNSFLTAYDISNPSDIKFLDKIQSNPGSNSIVHNTHIRGNYAITSWYQDGITIVDATQPDNLVQVGNYDTWPGSGGGFDGCWGVYPFLPSGTLIVSNITTPDQGSSEAFILTPAYKRACYLTGKVSHSATGNPIDNVQIRLVGGGFSEISALDGAFRAGQAQPGNFMLEFKKNGYATKTVPVTLTTGQTTVINTTLDALSAHTISGVVVKKGTTNPVLNAHVAIYNDDIAFETAASSNGQFTIPNVFAGKYKIVAGAWGYEYQVLDDQTIAANQTVTIELDKGYADDFIFDYGWKGSGTALTGVWERGVPLTTGALNVPKEDAPQDLGNQCMLTGNNGNNDQVESGTAILTSPLLNLRSYSDPYVQGALWCVSVDVFGAFHDSIFVYINNGSTEKLLAAFKGDQAGWRSLNHPIKSLLPLTSTMRLKIVCSDEPDIQLPDTYEAAFDQFKIVEAPLAVGDFPNEAAAKVQPNPFLHNTILEYQLPDDGATLQVFDITGRLKESVALSGTSGLATFGETLTEGIYMAQIMMDGKIMRTVKVVKIE